MKLFKLNYYVKLFVLGLFVTSTFNACQENEVVSTPQQSKTAKEFTANASRGGASFLIDHENCGGHTIERHIGKSDDYLRDRLYNSSISAASTFYDLNQAGQVIFNAISNNSTRVNNWLNGSGGFRLVLSYTHHSIIGKVLLRGEYYPYESNMFKVVLERNSCTGDGYKIVTAYPFL